MENNVPTDVARLYAHPNIGQILVTFEEDQEFIPVVNIKFKCRDTVINFTQLFEDPESGYEMAEAFFLSFDEEVAYDFCKKVIDEFDKGKIQ